MRRNSHFFLMISFRYLKSPKSSTRSNLVKQSSPWTQIIMESLISSNFSSHLKLLWIIFMKNKRQNNFLISNITTHPIQILTMEVTAIPVWIIISTEQSQILICMGSLIPCPHLWTHLWTLIWTHTIICTLLTQINLLLIKECPTPTWVCLQEANYQKNLDLK